MNSLGEYLHRWRRERGLSLREAARLTGGRVTHSTIRNLERGFNSRNQPYTITLHTLKSIAEGYGIPLDTLLERAGYRMGLAEPGPAPADLQLEVQLSLLCLSDAQRQALSRVDAAERCLFALGVLTSRGLRGGLLSRLLGVEAQHIEAVRQNGTVTPQLLDGLANLCGIPQQWLASGSGSSLQSEAVEPETCRWVDTIRQAREAGLRPQDLRAFVSLLTRQRI